MHTEKIPLQTIVQTGHSDRVLSIAISPDGQYLASGSAGDSAVKLWDMQTGTLIRNFIGHAGWITSIKFSPDGKHLLTAAWDSKAMLWDVLTGEKLIEYPVEYANSVCFTPDNKQIITVGGSGKGIAYLWGLSTDKVEKVYEGHTDEIIAASISSNGKLLVTGSTDGTAKLWDVQTAALIKTFTHAAPAFVHAVAIDPAADPKFIITAGSAEMHTVNPEKALPQEIKVWNIHDLQAEEPMHVFTGHTNNIYSIVISPDGKYVASASEDRAICLWSLDDKTGYNLVNQFTSFSKSVNVVCFSPNGRLLAAGGDDEIVKLFDIELNQETMAFTGQTAIVYAALLSPNGKYLVTGSEGNKVHLWDLTKNKGYTALYAERALQNPLAEIKALDISPDGKLLAIGCNDGIDGYNGSIRIFNLEQNTPVMDCTCPQAVSSVRFSEDGQYVVAGCDLGDYCYWHMAQDTPVWLPGEFAYWGTKVDMHTGRGYLVAALDHNLEDKPDMILIDLNDNNKRYPLSYKPNKLYKRQRVRSVRFSRDGRFLVSAHDDQKIRLWDITGKPGKAKCIREFDDPGHLWVIAAEFSAEGRYILNSSYDNSTHIWDIHSKSKQPVQVFAGHTAEHVARFSPDEKYIITASKDSTTKIWDRQSGEELATLIGIGESDWVLLTPSGLFDASPGALQKMHYVSGMEVIELEQLKGRYWEPGLLSIVTKFAEGNLKDVDKLTSLALYPEVVKMELEGSMLKVKLEKRSGGIGRTSLRINNKERERNINAERKTAFSIDLEQYERFFIEGENDIAIRCWNEEDWLPGPLHERKYNKTSSGVIAEPSLYAIFVGTSKYKNERFTLAFPDQDAGYMGDAVKIVGEQFFKTGEVHIRLLTTEDAGSTSFSNKTNIKAAFDEVAKHAKPQDVVVFYFSGHGANFDDGKKALYYYLTNEIVSDNLSDSGVRARATISSEELSDWINAIPAMKQVLILDTCYSGKIVDTLKSKNAVDATQEREMERMKDRTGMYVLAGSAADKVSYESSSYGQGLLTYTLLMGMRGAALLKNTNQQVNAVDVMNLFSFSKEEVERLSKEFDVVQTPTLRPPVKVASFSIGLAGPEEQRKIKLAMPKPIFVHSNFMNSHDFLDDLDIAETLDQYLMGKIGMGNRPQAIFIDVNYFPGAQQVRGIYSKTENGYQLKARVYKDRELKGSFDIEGQGAEDMVPKIAREVENYSFPAEEYKVPEDDEIGVLEKGLKDDLDKIVQKDLVDLMFGYKENFIGEKFKVSMPKLHAEHLKDVAFIIDPVTKAVTKESVLKYQYYSTIQNKKRKFPFFAACNLNGGAFLTAGRNGVFVADPRIPKDQQCGDELYTFKYKGQAYTTFCHRGHMAKREDPQWADKVNLKIFYKSDPPVNTITEPAKKDKAVLTSIAERGARLTFFFTNAIPQHGHLNGVVWRGLEDYIMAVATNNKKVQGPDLYKINIMTGPVFNDDDPVFPLHDDDKKKGLQVPTLFWKVVYFTKEDGKLYHVGFLMGQAELLKLEFERLDGLKAKEITEAAEEKEPPFEGYKNKAVFQVKISFIESLTKLKFHPAIDPYNDSRPAKEIIEKVQLAKKNLAGDDDGFGYSLEGLSI